MSAAVLSIGTELLRGEIVNTNASWLAEKMTELGVDVAAIETVGDDPERIGSALRRLAGECDVVIGTGGLGPTTDDRTSAAVAAMLGVPLVRDAASLEAIRQRMERFGRKMAPSNESQADFPEGARVLPNSVGTAPGFSVMVGRARAFFLPGVPREMKAMFDAQVAREVSASGATGALQVRLKTFGLPESTINDRLEGIEAAYGVTLGYRAHFPEIEVKILAPRTRGDAEGRARRAAEAVTERLGDVVFAEGERTLPEIVGELLRQRGLSFAAAESCTGGLLAKMMTDAAGASDYFSGCIVSYDNRIKSGLLGVPEALLEQVGAVSAEVARAMAEGARTVLGVDVAVGVTGVAGPGGASVDKPVGLVHYAVATADGTTNRHFRFPGTRTQVRAGSAFAALSLVRAVLLRGHGGLPDESGG